MADDFASRRAQLLDTLLRIVAERGLDEVSVRTLAAEAGVSPAKVQYYFRTKDEMLTAAFQHIEQRLYEHFDSIPFDGRVREYLRAVTVSWLPTDKETAAMVRTWVAFIARAMVAERLAALERDYQHRTEHNLIALIKHGVANGEFASDTEPATEASLLLALNDGLALRMLNDPEGMPPERAAAVLDAYLAHHPRPAANPRRRL